MARLRLELAAGLRMLELTAAAEALADDILWSGLPPPSADSGARDFFQGPSPAA